MRAFPSWQVLTLLAGISGGLACAPAAAEAVAVQGLQQPWIGAVSGDSHRSEIDQLLASSASLTGASELRGHGPSGRAAARLETMFSSQAGSWPFEPFVKNSDLFRQIANYQAQHPRILEVRGGSITLEQLVAAVGNSQVLRSHRDGYLLSYPLLIAANAELRLDGSRLYLNSHSGAALINQGRLVLNNAHLESWSGENASNEHAYRPFVMAWAGSTTLIEGSTLTRLGQNSHLSRGLTVGRSDQQGPGVPPARLLVSKSLFSEMANGIELRQAVAVIEDSRFLDVQLYAVDILDSRATLSDNHVDGVRSNSGVRVRGQGHSALRRNSILGAAKAGLEARDFEGVLVANNNTFGKAGSNGIQLRRLGAGSLVLLADNLIANPGRTGIDADVFGQLLISGNSFGNSPEYGLYLRNAAAGEGRAVVVGNSFSGIGMSMIKSEGVGRLVLGNNQFKTRAGRQTVLAGDLLPAQSSVMDATVSRPCFVEVRIGGGGTQEAAGTLDCGSGS